jgi:hypothetical protein
MYATGWVYIAAQYERKEEMRKYRDELQAMGITTTSRWLDGNNQEEGLGADDLNATPWRGMPHAVLDTEDVMKADTFIMFTSGLGRGGHHTELGMALTTNKEIFLIGKRENVFHCLSAITVFPDWETFIAAMRAL